MTHQPETVSPDLNLRELVDQYFFLRSYQSFPVVENGRVVGMITLNQLKEIPHDQWTNQTVRDTMTSVNQSLFVHPQEKLSEVLHKMEDSGVRRVLVVDREKLEGIITASDITRWLRRAKDREDWKGSR
jgi:CBS domain-containing protein